MPNPFTHVELATNDVDKAKAFYGQLFNWQLQDIPMNEGFTYTMINVGTGTGGGMMKQMMPGGASAWMPYIAVDDIHASTAKAQSLGAKLCKEVTEVMDHGWLSIFTDPTGAAFGLWQEKKK